MLVIRDAILEDVSAIGNVICLSWQSAYRGIVRDKYLDSLDGAHWRDRLHDSFSNNISFGMVLEEDKKIIGSAILTSKKREVNLVSFYLIPEKIGQGLGHFFYNGLEEELRQKGFKKCKLDVLQDNIRAIHFYELHGYIDVKTIFTIQLDDCEYKCKAYEKKL